MPFIDIIPRFTTDIAACHSLEESEELVALYPIEWYDEDEHDQPEAVVVLNMLRWLGINFFIRQQSDPVPYLRYLEIVKNAEEGTKDD